MFLNLYSGVRLPHICILLSVILCATKVLVGSISWKNTLLLCLTLFCKVQTLSLQGWVKMYRLPTFHLFYFLADSNFRKCLVFRCGKCKVFIGTGETWKYNFTWKVITTVEQHLQTIGLVKESWLQEMSGPRLSPSSDMAAARSISSLKLGLLTTKQELSSLSHGMTVTTRQLDSTESGRNPSWLWLYLNVKRSGMTWEEQMNQNEHLIMENCMQRFFVGMSLQCEDTYCNWRWK